MKGLVVKEFILLYKNFMFQILAFLLIGIIGVLSDRVSFILYIPLIMSILSVSGMALDETSKWTKYSMSLPADKKDIVTSKYIVSLFCSLISTVLVMICMIANMIIYKDFSLDRILYITFGSFVVSSVFPSVLFPFYFKFGASKGRIIYLLTIGLICGSVSVIITSGSDILDILVKLTSNTTLLISLTIAALIVLTIISWGISSAVYRKKEL